MITITAIGIVTGIALLVGFLFTAFCYLTRNEEEKKDSTFSGYMITALIVSGLFFVVVGMGASFPDNQHTVTVTIKDKCCSEDNTDMCYVIDTNNVRYIVSTENYNAMSIGNTYIARTWISAMREWSGDSYSLYDPVLKDTFRSCKDAGVDC